MSTNLTALGNAALTSKSLADLILVTPNKRKDLRPQTSFIDPLDVLPDFGDTFLFDYEGEQSITLQSNITDHYVEKNLAIQNSIALAPEIISISGFIGELTDIAPPELEFVKTYATRLYTLQAYVPELSLFSELAYTKAKFIYDSAITARKAAIQAWNTISNGDPLAQTKQQIAFNKLYGYYINRTLFTVQTPWSSFKNMAIQNLKAVQDSESESFTNFEITFKRINFASTKVQKLRTILQLADGRLSSQQFQGDSVNIGNQTPEQSDTVTDRITKVK